MAQTPFAMTPWSYLSYNKFWERTAPMFSVKVSCWHMPGAADVIEASISAEILLNMKISPSAGMSEPEKATIIFFEKFHDFSENFFYYIC